MINSRYTCLLQEKYDKQPLHLFVSASMAPHLYQSPLVHELADQKFMELLQLLDFTNTKALVQDREMRELMFPTLRADFEAVATYSRDFSSPKFLDVPMTAFAGKQDIFAAPNAMLLWREYTTNSFQFWMLDIHHYFVETHQPFLLRVISHTLSEHIAPGSAGSLMVLPEEAERITFEPQQQEARKIISSTVPQQQEARKIISSTVKDLEIDPNLWLDFLCPNPAAEKRLFCFPPALGSDPYPQFLAALPENIELCSIQLPGRGKQAGEISWRNISDVVDVLTLILANYLDKPFAFFGHCIGGIIMYEVACRLHQQYKILPSHFFCSGVASPHLYFMPNIYLLDDDKIMEVLEVIGHPFTRKLSNDQQFRQKWMPTIRADFEMMTSYQPPKQEEALNMPITLFRGRADLWLAFYGVDSWKNCTTNSFELITHLGDHFFMQTDPSFVVDAIGKRI